MLKSLLVCISLSKSMMITGVCATIALLIDTLIRSKTPDCIACSADTKSPRNLLPDLHKVIILRAWKIFTVATSWLGFTIAEAPDIFQSWVSRAATAESWLAGWNRIPKRSAHEITGDHGPWSTDTQQPMGNVITFYLWSLCQEDHSLLWPWHWDIL